MQLRAVCSAPAIPTACVHSHVYAYADSNSVQRRTRVCSSRTTLSELLRNVSEAARKVQVQSGNWSY